ncbi:MAG: D-2-hydroxyacid dehydrogenase [Campylobacterales bacterium]|nr:D-2-hydroxyacid dehydrogenase [Campylobacterales bacterium]
MNIVFLDADTIGNTSLAKLQKLGNLSIYKTTSQDLVVSRAIDADILITNKVVIDANNLSKLPKLRLVCVAATGVNNIDLQACQKKGVAVYNVKGYSTDSVAQSVFTSLFYFLSNISFFDKYVKDGSYSKSPIFTCMDKEYSEVCGKTLGIIGFGEIGQKVAKIAKAFGIKVVYYSTSGKNDKKGYKRVELDALLEKSDFVSLHCSLNENTKNLICADKLKIMNKKAVLINFARGRIVDEKALANALNQGVIAGYISDVFEKEPILSDSPLLSVKEKQKLVLTPHIAWASVEARRRLMDGVVKNIQSFLNDKSDNRVI